MNRKKISIFFQVFVILAAAFIFSPKVGAQTVDPDNFVIESFVADYYLSHNENDRSVLSVQEQVTARFPDYDQNHGIIRAIPKTYKDHPIKTNVISVADSAGNELPYKESSQNDNVILRIGDADEYVQGIQTYVISYEMQDVTSAQENGDEFYWDVNGNQWSQPFNNVTARVHLDSSIADAMRNQKLCFTGEFGDTNQNCAVTEVEKNNSVVVTVEANGQLEPGQTLSFVLGFDKGTFASYQKDWWPIIVLIASLSIPPLLCLAIMIRQWRKFGRDPKGKGTIVPEYLPPKDLSLVESELVLHERYSPKSISAQILDLAVRGNIKILEEKKNRAILGDKTFYKLQFIKMPESKQTDSKKVIKMLFGDSPKKNKKVNLEDLKHKLATSAAKIGKEATLRLTKRRYFKIKPSTAKTPYIIIGSLLAVIGFVGVIFAVPLVIGIGIAGLVILTFSPFMPARTQKGVFTKEYLFGLKDYMELAEADRIKVLQGPKGKLLQKIDVNDKTQLIKLYEKLLPFAVLFGIEKDWAGQFADLYEDQPDWYHGTGAFNAVILSSAISDFSSYTTGGFSSSSSSSGSGFSGGGGFAGGGGGGGGGGGW